MPIFLRMVPDRNPRTECGCQPVAFISSSDVAPPGRFSSSRIAAALLPARAESPFSSRFGPLGAFLAELAFFPDLAFFDATCARRAPAWAVFVAFGSALAGAVLVCSLIDVISSPLAVGTAVMTSIPLIAAKRKVNLQIFFAGDGTAMTGKYTRATAGPPQVDLWQGTGKNLDGSRKKPSSVFFRTETSKMPPRRFTSVFELCFAG